MHGNRDFLLAGKFCEMSGAELLPDPLIVTLYGEPVLVMHGDALCTTTAPTSGCVPRCGNPIGSTGFYPSPSHRAAPSRAPHASAAARIRRIGVRHHRRQRRQRRGGDAQRRRRHPVARPHPPARHSRLAGRRPILHSHRPGRLVQPRQPAALGPQRARTHVPVALNPAPAARRPAPRVHHLPRRRRRAPAVRNGSGIRGRQRDELRLERGEFRDSRLEFQQRRRPPSSAWRHAGPGPCTRGGGRFGIVQAAE